MHHLALLLRPPWPPLLVIAWGLLIFFPRLGSVGLWDPWETHFGEVAREMIIRGDFVYPHWESAHFFSKPVFPIWMIAAGLLAFGAETGQNAQAPLGALAEWGVRTPFALLAIGCLLAVYRVGARMGGRRCGLIAALVLGSCPQFVFIGKQAMTDMPLVGLSTIGVALLIEACFAKPRAPSRLEQAVFATLFLGALLGQLLLIGARTGAWVPVAATAALGIGICWLGLRSSCYLLGASAFFGFAALSKGLAPLAIFGPVVVLYMAVSADWDLLRRAKLQLTIPGFLLIASPWYVTLSLFGGRNKEGLTFVQRFWLHDNLNRAMVGVHGDRGALGYYLEQLAWGMFPWSALSPLALYAAAQRRRKLVLFVLVWALWSYLLFSLMRTKFHQYIFPALPPLSLLIAFWIRWCAPKLRPRSALLILALFIVSAHDLGSQPQRLVNLFTYKYDRDYPRELAPRLFLVPLFITLGLALLYQWRRRATQIARPLMFGAPLLALWLSHHHFNMLSQHWSQGWVFETFYEERKDAEPLYAYQLNWRGETFYSRNHVLQIMGAGADLRMRTLLARPGRSFVLLEQRYLDRLKRLIPRGKVLRVVDASNHNFYLCVVSTPV